MLLRRQASISCSPGEAPWGLLKRARIRGMEGFTSTSSCWWGVDIVVERGLFEGLGSCVRLSLMMVFRDLER